MRARQKGHGSPRRRIHYTAAAGHPQSGIRRHPSGQGLHPGARPVRLPGNELRLLLRHQPHLHAEPGRLFTGKHLLGHEQAVCAYRNSGISDTGRYWDPPVHATMIRRGRHKRRLYHDDERGELYDMESDPREERNLWDEPARASCAPASRERLLEWELARELANDARGGEALPRPDQRVVNALRPRP